MNSEELQLLPFRSGDGGLIPIAVRFARPAPSKPVFMWFNGFKSDMGGAKALALTAWAKQNGAGCLRFDYSGHGRSGGVFEEGTISAWLDQASAVRERLRGDEPTVFVGSSMGGWIALLLARKLKREGGRMPEGIVLIAPAWNMTELMWEMATEEARASILRDGIWKRPSAYADGDYAITKTLIGDGKNHLLKENSFALNIPVRILHGCEDPDVPWRHSLELLSRLETRDMRLTLIKDGEHRLSRPQDLSLLFSTLAEFI